MYTNASPYLQDGMRPKKSVNQKNTEFVE